ncbi:MAG: DNA polymerase II large subunit [Candidatus Woesearchaeota archaeon]
MNLIKMTDISPEMEEYFKNLETEAIKAYNLAKIARSKGLDPVPDVEIKLARNMAERVEGLMSASHPQLVGSGVIQRIQELEKQYEPLDWRVALEIAKEVALQKFCRFETVEECIIAGIRTGFAYITLGIVAAPLEGITEVNIKKRRDGKDYLAIKFAGPVRGAGGTAAAVCVIIADYVRKAMQLYPYDPTEEEIKRYIIEVNDYAEKVTTLQYHPTAEEIEFLIRNIPIELDGDPTETYEVSNYKDLPRVKTNRIRGGMVLVLTMIALKAPKLLKRLAKWGKAFNLEEWQFIDEFVKLQERIKSHSQEKSEESNQILPNYAYLHDVVSGRPILSYPLQPGGFRLRYGRSRASGYSACSINPATQIVLNEFIANATQLKVERPGKAASVTSCTSIEGPIVRLKDGSVVKIKTVNQAIELKSQIEKILYLGDILFNYGDFSENNARLVPSAFVEEWWKLEVEKTLKESGIDMNSLDRTLLDQLQDPIRNKEKIKAFDALNWCEKYNIPLHPKFVPFWKLISKEDLSYFCESLKKSRILRENLKIPLNEKIKTILEKLGIEHIVKENQIVLEKEISYVIAKIFNLKFEDDPFQEDTETRKYNESILESIIKTISDSNEDSLTLIRKISKLDIRDTAGTFVGARMGRPEKAKGRTMRGSPHVLFPVGDEGGKTRSLNNALEKGKITAEFAIYFCEKCNKETIYPKCEVCGEKTKEVYFCNICGTIEKPCEHNCKRFREITLDVRHYFEHAKNILNDRVPDLIKGVRGTSNKHHIPELLVKGFLRAKHDLNVNKDGTIRFDASEIPLTHFKPKELIGVTIEKLRELGYMKDIYGNELTNPDQIVELKPLDIILSADIPGIECADEFLIRVCKFVDEELSKVYNLEPYYNVSRREDLIGKLVIGLAPHTSAGTIGRIIGFAKIQGLIAHPLFHAALRRDCDGDEGGIMLLLDAFLNFSREYLPDARGARTMDAPLVLTLNIKPAEVDDMVLGMDTASSYSLDFYYATLQCKMPSEVKIEQLKDRLNTPKQYENFGFTHDTENINLGVPISSYKVLPSMLEKLQMQMDLAEKLCGVNAKDVAELIIDKHFMKDIKGNLRKFSIQTFRCVNCNEIYRRVPLKGVCVKCGGKLVFTVSEGAVTKYLEPALNMARKYGTSAYLRESLELVNLRIASIFKIQKNNQKNLSEFFA